MLTMPYPDLQEDICQPDLEKQHILPFTFSLIVPHHVNS